MMDRVVPAQVLDTGTSTSGTEVARTCLDHPRGRSFPVNPEPGRHCRAPTLAVVEAGPFRTSSCPRREESCPARAEKTFIYTVFDPLINYATTWCNNTDRAWTR